MRIFVILPAAGLGTRMSHTDAPKQFLSIGGVPVLIRSIHAFLAIPAVSSITVAVRASETQRVKQQIAQHLPKTAKPVAVVEGGDTRQESVGRALASLADAQDDDLVLVHDAVRPLIDAGTIERTIDAVKKHGAAIVATPALDTIKVVERTSDGAIITSTIPRERVVLAQTPQGFRVGLLRKAFAEAEADGFVGTDEASLAERAGIPVAVVAGPPRNFKITQPGDLELAEFYFSPHKSPSS
jgi:2-C-methyl-D-erythritol 4-phosphate cytidylyltransferase